MTKHTARDLGISYIDIIPLEWLQRITQLFTGNYWTEGCIDSRNILSMAALRMGTKNIAQWDNLSYAFELEKHLHEFHMHRFS